MPLLPIAEHCGDPLGLGEAGRGARDVSDGDRSVEHRGGVVVVGVVAQRDQLVVPLEDLRPVGLRRRRGVGMERGDRRLDLVAARALLGERALQDRDASAISAVSQSDRSCSSSGTNWPSASVRAGSRACWSISSASSPRASGSGVASVSWRVRRIASLGQVVSPTVAGVVHERQHAKHDRQIARFGERGGRAPSAWHD